MLDELDEDAPGGGGVEEGDAVPTGAGSGVFVHGFVAPIQEVLEGVRDIRDPEGDVMEPGSVPIEETSDGSFGVSGLEELHPPDERDLHALLREDLDLGTGFAGYEFKEWAGLLDGGDRHGDVIEGMGMHGIGIFRVTGGRRPSGSTASAAGYLRCRYLTRRSRDG